MNKHPITMTVTLDNENYAMLYLALSSDERKAVKYAAYVAANSAILKIDRQHNPKKYIDVM